VADVDVAPPATSVRGASRPGLVAPVGPAAEAPNVHTPAWHLNDGPGCAVRQPLMPPPPPPPPPVLPLELEAVVLLVLVVLVGPF
jgi:hypothetical protein